MRALIETLAMRGAPSVSDLIEHDRQIVWPMQRVQSSVYNVETPAIAFAEVPDIALVAWLHRDALIKKLDAEIDAEADDAAALTHEARQKAEAEVMGDLLAVERAESALVWRAMDERLPAEHRADCAACAILGVQLITVPRAEVRGTSLQHVIDIIAAMNTIVRAGACCLFPASHGRWSLGDHLQRHLLSQTAPLGTGERGGDAQG
jgi:hypothetical protein